MLLLVFQAVALGHINGMTMGTVILIGILLAV